MLEKAFQKFQAQSKLQNQILILLLLSSIIPLSVTGIYGIFSSTSALSNLAETKLENEVDSEAKNIAALLEDVGRDVLLVSKTPPVQGIVRARAGGGKDRQDNSSYEEWVKRMQIIFTGTMEAKPYYTKIRYLDENGNEIVRVDRDDANNIKLITDRQLQNQGDRPFFTETIKLSANSVYTSPIDLSQEYGTSEKKYQAVIRYATPIVDSAGQKRGILVANILASEFIKFVKKANLSQGEVALLINQDGYYLSHPNADKQWGFVFKKNEKLPNDYPLKIAQQILTSPQGLIDEDTDQIIAYHKIVPNPKQPEFLVVINQIPKETVFATVNSFKIVASVIMLLSLATVLPLGIVRARQLASLIKQLVNGISTSSQEISATLEEQERVASQQAASVNETTTTMDELEASCRQSSEQAKAAVNAAQQSLELAQHGTQAVEETLEGMFTLEKKVTAIAQQIVHLSEQAGQIGNISQLVSDLANQTNMLALNSSVEAVRAGEHGKGFSVVANEIRKLADQSQRSGEKINTLVSQIQSAVNSTVMVTEEGTKTVATGIQSTQRTDQAFSGVVDAVNEVVLNNQQISLNLKQQVDGIQQVVQAMDVINKGARETATGITQTKVGTQQLNEVALTLKQKV